MRSVPIIIIVGIVIRLVLLRGHGFYYDVNAFTTWMLAIADIGPHALYADTSNVRFPAVDYPPGYLYVLWVLGKLTRLFLGQHPPELATRIIIKIPAVLADFGVALGVARLVARFADRKAVVRTWAFILLAPMLWIVSAYWAQVDSVSSLAFVWTLVAAVENRFFLAWVLLAVTVSIKPQPVVCAPLLLLFQFRVDSRRAQLVLGPALGLLVAYLITVPFAPTLQPVGVFHWLVERYLVGVAKYPYNSTGAFTIFTIFDDFYTSDARRLFGVSLHTLGLAMFGLAAVGVLARAAFLMRKFERSRADEIFLLSSFMMLASLFMLTTRMHERYLMPAIVLLPLLFGRGRLDVIAAAALAFDFSVNVVFILRGFHGGHHRPSIAIAGHILSAINLIAFIWFWFSYLRRGTLCDVRYRPTQVDGLSKIPV